MRQFKKVTPSNLGLTLRLMSQAVEQSPNLEKFREIWKDYLVQIPNKEELTALGDQIAVKLYSEVLDYEPVQGSDRAE